MVYILDILLVVLLALSMWNGYRNGFVRAMSHLVALALAALIAPLFSGSVAQAVYDSQLGPALEHTVIRQVHGTGEEVVNTAADDVMANLPSSVKKTMRENGIVVDAKLTAQLSKNATVQIKKAVSSAFDKMVRPVMISVLEVVVTVLSVMGIFALLLMILGLADKYFKLPVLKKLNGVLGLIPGAVNGAVVVLVAVMLIQFLASVSPETALINTTVLENTWLTGWLAKHNPITTVFRDMLSTELTAIFP